MTQKLKITSKTQAFWSFTTQKFRAHKLVNKVLATVLIFNKGRITINLKQSSSIAVVYIIPRCQVNNEKKKHSEKLLNVADYNITGYELLKCKKSRLHCKCYQKNASDIFGGKLKINIKSKLLDKFNASF